MFDRISAGLKYFGRYREKFLFQLKQFASEKPNFGRKAKNIGRNSQNGRILISAEAEIFCFGRKLISSIHSLYNVNSPLEVATVAARTKLFIVRTTPHPPTNVTVTEAKSFQVRVVEDHQKIDLRSRSLTFILILDQDQILIFYPKDQ